MGTDCCAPRGAGVAGRTIGTTPGPPLHTALTRSDASLAEERRSAAESRGQRDDSVLVSTHLTRQDTYFP
jgi:hypothetical protein